MYVKKIRQLIFTTGYHQPAVYHQSSLEMEWMLPTANEAGANAYTYLPKLGGARDNKFWSLVFGGLINNYVF
jgi:hypothetical protein